MKEISDVLNLHLSDYLQIKLSIFKRNIVEGESFVCHVFGELSHAGPFDLRLEGVILLQVRDALPPNIDAELFIFSRGERLGLQRFNGESFLPIHLQLTGETPKWESKGWLVDGSDDWGNITQLRSSLYNGLEDTWEDNE